MNTRLIKLRAIAALGLPSISRAIVYRAGVALGFNSVRRLEGERPRGDEFFFAPPVENTTFAGLERNRQWDGKQTLFGFHAIDISTVPKWNQNPFNGAEVDASAPWWKIPDFNPQVGDIKTVWERSRFDWVVAFAQLSAQGDEDAQARLNCWMADWCNVNPPYLGANWKCGQETSIRVMHLAIAAGILGQYKDTSPALIDLIKLHLQRIAPTMGYAIAQNNNHGTSEAAALYIGGSWLWQVTGDKQALAYQRTGLKWLENRARKLILNDGSFSQYSTNYHRVVLDTYVIAEWWRSLIGLPRFSATLYQRIGAASHWLFQIVDDQSGDAPNLGPNDGARLLPLSDTDYRDYRPTVQVATVLFGGQCAYDHGSGKWNTPLHWLDIEIPKAKKVAPQTSHFPDGGYSCLRKGGAFAFFTIPKFRFRPSHADALHLDFWVNGANLLRDGGTYSYADTEFSTYFASTQCHNTIEFDERDQMPRVSRFLFGEWLKATNVSGLVERDGYVASAAAYTDYKGATHRREVRLYEDRLQVIDDISGFEKRAVLRWRLKPGDWHLSEGVAQSRCGKLLVSAQVPVARREIVSGLESRYYLDKTELPIFEVEVNQPGQLITEVLF